MFEAMVVIVGALSTLALSKKLGAVRASALATLVFYLILLPVTNPLELKLYSSLFFAGSFIGMSNASKIEVILASIVFLVFYENVAMLLGGLGGVLGLGAFLGIFIVLAFKAAVFKVLALHKH